jgi:hypothetical protein
LIYQLPNGKIIRLSLEEFLNLSDEDITYIESLDIGESASTPWTGSSLPERGRTMNIESYEESDIEPGDITFDDIDDDIGFLDELEN